MATQPESRLQRRIQQALAEAYPGCWVVKINVSEFQAMGTPDLLCCIRGCFFAFEVKTPTGGNPSAIQEHTMAMIRAAGGVALCVRSPGDALAAVRARLRMGYNK